MIVILIYILIGFLLATIGYTIIDSFCEIIVYAVALYKAKMNFKITKYNTEINNLTTQEQTTLIGFSAPKGEDDCE